MVAVNGWSKRLGERYWVWRIYHALVADAVSLQRPTKFATVYEFLGGELGRVADVGCGPGVFLSYLAPRAKHVLAADVDEASLKRVWARHRESKNVRYVVTLVNRLPFPDGQLDTLLFLEVLEHLRDDAGAIRELRRVLVPGGKLVLSVPVPPGEINPDDPYGHKREGYTREQLEALLKSEGFEVEEHRFAQFKYSRMAEKWLRNWRKYLKLPAPIFLSWPCYLDHLLRPEARQAGEYLPSCIIIKAKRL